MTVLHVQPAALRQASSELAAAVTVAHEVHARSAALRTTAVATGDPAGERALEEFLGAWSYGMRLVGDDVQALAGLLRHAADAYDGLEAHLQAVCRG